MLSVTFAGWPGTFPPLSVQYATFRVRSDYADAVSVVMQAQVQGSADGGNVGQGAATLQPRASTDIRIMLQMPGSEGTYQLVAETYANGTRVIGATNYGMVTSKRLAEVIIVTPGVPGSGGGSRSITETLFEYLQREPILALGMAAAVVIGWKYLSRD